jgi:hypothetical protein
MDPKKIAEALGAEHVGHVETHGGPIGAAQTLAEVQRLKAERKAAEIQRLKDLAPVPRYTAEYVRAEVDKDRERLFAPYAVGRSSNWACDPGTKDLVCVAYWLREELTRLGVDDRDRRAQESYYNRWSRSDSDYFAVAATALNTVLDVAVDRYRRPHHRWG